MADLTLPTVGVYFLGTLITFWCLFIGVANFKTRNDPGGTVKMEVTRQGETKVIEVDRAKAQGSVGLGGSVPDQTGTVGGHLSDGGADDGADIIDPDTSATSSSSAGGQTRGAAGGTATRTNGGTTRTNGGTTTRTDGAETWQSSSSAAEAADRYCGNCQHFEYVRTERGIQPYCGFHDGLMEDMDACEDWSGR